MYSRLAHYICLCHSRRESHTTFAFCHSRRESHTTFAFCHSRRESHTTFAFVIPEGNPTLHLPLSFPKGIPLYICLCHSRRESHTTFAFVIPAGNPTLHLPLSFPKGIPLYICSKILFALYITFPTKSNIHKSIQQIFPNPRTQKQRLIFNF